MVTIDGIKNIKQKRIWTENLNTIESFFFDEFKAVNISSLLLILIYGEGVRTKPLTNWRRFG